MKINTSLRIVVLVAISILQIKVGLVALGCGGSSISLDPPSNNDGGGSDDCTDTGATVSSGDFSAAFTGEACNAPDVTAPEDDQLILDCTSRDTDDSVSDYVTVTCGSGDGADSDIYFCFDGIAYRDGGESADTELYDQTTLDCVLDDSDNGSIGEEETIVS